MIFDGHTPVQTTYSLPEEAAEVTISVKDELGNVVYNTTGDRASGDHSFPWDGKNNDGFIADPGIYSISVSATSSATAGKSLNVGTRVPGIVEGIESGPNGDILLNIGPDKVSITSVTKARIPTYVLPPEESGGDTGETGDTGDANANDNT